MFLHSSDGKGHKVFNKTTALESLGFLATRCRDPLKHKEREAVFYMDNAATVLALDRGHSKDRLVSVIIRASRGGVLALDAGGPPEGGGQSNLQL